MKKEISLMFILIIFITLFFTSGAWAQNISELIGEVKYVTEQGGGYYVLLAGGKQFVLINLPRQQGQVKEGKYHILGIATIDFKDQLVTGPIPLQVSKMDFMGPLNQSGEQVKDGTKLQLKGLVFFYTNGAVPTYMLEVIGQDKKHIFYSITNIPGQPGQIARGIYNVSGIIGSQNPSGIGTPLILTNINPVAPQNSQQSQNTEQQNTGGEMEFTGQVFFMSANQGGGGYYILQTQNREQYTLINLPQEAGKYQTGQYKVKGVISDVQTPYSLGTPMKVTAINLISAIANPAMDNSLLNQKNEFFNNDEGEEGEEGDSYFFDSGASEGGNDGGGF